MDRSGHEKASTEGAMQGCGSYQLEVASYMFVFFLRRLFRIDFQLKPEALKHETLG